jgi:ABC-type nickel/cobalt efflux system permease component RcnA
LWLLALAFGAAHAIQPGHGKTLVAATVIGEGGSWAKGIVLAAAATLTHTGSVLLVAAGLWLSRTSRYAEIDRALAACAGFVIAAIGIWRLGRHLAGYGEHDDEDRHMPNLRLGRIVSLGAAGGLVPCWDAVALIVLADAVGRLALGVTLLVAFGLGMGGVLVAVGWLAARVQPVFTRGREAAWERRLGIASGVALSAIGLYLLL